MCVYECVCLHLFDCLAHSLTDSLTLPNTHTLIHSYLYFHKAPNAKEFHVETVDKLKGLHLFDCLRANKSTSAWGVEVRVPFLDRDFLDTAMTINAEDKMIRKVGLCVCVSGFNRSMLLSSSNSTNTYL